MREQGISKCLMDCKSTCRHMMGFVHAEKGLVTRRENHTNKNFVKKACTIEKNRVNDSLNACKSSSLICV